MKKFELTATCQKSYYMKALVLQYENGDAFLQSYDTIVCGIIGGEFFRYWDDYSTTTMHHVNDFRNLYGLPKMNKKSWINMTSLNAPVYYSDDVAADHNCGVPAYMYL